jgi:hypothetical protein
LKDALTFSRTIRGLSAAAPLRLYRLQPFAVEALDELGHRVTGFATCCFSRCGVAQASSNVEELFRPRYVAGWLSVGASDLSEPLLLITGESA